ncbi:hypothetical protein TcWFU_008020 [Taenia crassiceps]|uniref:Secreted protein n=1 Tax=Taenia crassiceps TaxID=6207 RepID=A0ABR4QLN5_9CEST
MGLWNTPLFLVSRSVTLLKVASGLTNERQRRLAAERITGRHKAVGWRLGNTKVMGYINCGQSIFTICRSGGGV